MNNALKTLGIDLAKNIFQLHGTNGAGKQVLSKRLSRSQLIEFMSNCTCRAWLVLRRVLEPIIGQ